MKRWVVGLGVVQLLFSGACDGGAGRQDVIAAEQVGVVEERVEVAGVERSSLTAEQKVEDVEYLYHLMKENYPYIKASERMTGLDWLSMQDYYEQRAATLEDGRVAYVKIPSLQNERKEADLRQMIPFLEQQKDADALIFDIRGNGGGDSDYWFRIVQRLTNQPRSWTTYQLFRGGEFAKSFIESKMGIDYTQLTPIETLKNENLPSLPPETFTDFDRYSKDEMQMMPHHPIDFDGRIYLLVDAGVFSSAEAWANFAKESGWATLVGERTGGDGIGWEGAYVALPNSGYVFRMELMMGIDATGASNFEVRTLPDIEVDYSQRFTESGDPYILTVLEEEKLH